MIALWLVDVVVVDREDQATDLVATEQHPTVTTVVEVVIFGPVGPTGAAAVAAVIVVELQLVLENHKCHHL